MTEEEKKAAEEKAAAEADAAATAKLNAAIASHTKRLKADFDKQLAEIVARLTPAAPPADKSAEGAPASKADPELVKMRETIEKLTKAHAEAEARAKATEEKARKDGAYAALRESLEAKGIKGAKARAVIADLELTGALRFDEETGAPLLAIKRARSKGAKAEELVFDLADGVDDWAKTADAADFLPPAGAPKTPVRAPSTVAPGASRRAPTTASADRELSDAEVADLLAAQGHDIGAAFR